MATFSHFVSAQDGLRLHLRDYGPQAPIGLPVLCLPGLTRNAEEFAALAFALAADDATPRRVLAMDYRGRGLSDRDPQPANYNVGVEAADVLAALAALEIERTVIVGSSRGGLIAMALAALNPTVLAGVIFNDIGPVIELDGLLRIKSYAGKMKRPVSFNDAVAQQKMLFADQFPALGNDEWQGLARRAWRTVESDDGRVMFEPTCDPAVALSLMTLTPDTVIPPAWHLFDALAHVPLMVIRGEHSDLLSPATVAEMQRRRPDMMALDVAGQGHTPLLADAPTIEALRAFLSRLK